MQWFLGGIEGRGASPSPQYEKHTTKQPNKMPKPQNLRKLKRHSKLLTVRLSDKKMY